MTDFRPIDAAISLIGGLICLGALAAGVAIWIALIAASLTILVVVARHAFLRRPVSSKGSHNRAHSATSVPTPPPGAPSAYS